MVEETGRISLIECNTALGNAALRHSHQSQNPGTHQLIKPTELQGRKLVVHFSWVQLILIIAMLTAARPFAATFAGYVHCPYSYHLSEKRTLPSQVSTERLPESLLLCRRSKSAPMVTQAFDQIFSHHVKCENHCSIACRLEPDIVVWT